ncbi:unnamed protein product, partial [Ilex paraguariensis]
VAALPEGQQDLFPSVPFLSPIASSSIPVVPSLPACSVCDFDAMQTHQVKSPGVTWCSLRIGTCARSINHVMNKP